MFILFHDDIKLKIEKKTIDVFILFRDVCVSLLFRALIATILVFVKIIIVISCDDLIFESLRDLERMSRKVVESQVEDLTQESIKLFACT